MTMSEPCCATALASHQRGRVQSSPVQQFSTMRCSSAVDAVLYNAVQCNAVQYSTGHERRYNTVK